MAYIARARRGACQIRLEERHEGTYAFVYLTENSRFPERDYLQDSIELAMRFSEEDYGVQREEWKEVPDDHTLT